MSESKATKPSPEKTKAAQKAADKIKKTPLSEKPEKKGEVLVDILTEGTEIGGRSYKKGEQEKISRADFEILAEAGAVREAKGDNSEGPILRLEVVAGPFKRPGWTFAAGARFDGPAGLAKAHPKQLKIVGTK